MKKKYFVCSDIHGFYDIWVRDLNKSGFDMHNNNHIIIVCGDLLDRGSQALQCLQFVHDLILENRIICIKGNHEYLFDEVYKVKYFGSHDVSNGTLDTYLQLTEDKKDQYTSYQQVINDGYNNSLYQFYKAHLIDYYETEKYIFVHGWIPVDYQGHPVYKPDWRNSDSYDFESASWLNPFAMWQSGIIEPNKTIVCGHWSTSYAHANIHHKGSDFHSLRIHNLDELKNVRPKPVSKIFKDKGIIGLDATTPFSRRVNILTLTNGMKPVKKEM